MPSAVGEVQELRAELTRVRDANVALRAEQARGEERDKGLAAELASLRAAVERLDARVWWLVAGGAAASGVVSAAANHAPALLSAVGLGGH